MMEDNLIEVILRGKGSRISNDFHEPIRIPADVNAQIGVKNFSTYNNIPNIVAAKNNSFKFRVPGDRKWHIFAMPTGAYELAVIAKQFEEHLLVKFPHLQNVGEKFRLLGNNATSKAEFCFLDDYGIDFNIDASMHDLLGFDKDDRYEGIGLYIGKRIVNITNVTQLVFNCNITSSNYINGMKMPFLYNCSVDVPAGYRLGRELTSIAYKSPNTSQISFICVWIVDEHGTPVNLREDDLTVTLSLRFNPRAAAVKLLQDDPDAR